MSFKTIYGTNDKGKAFCLDTEDAEMCSTTCPLWMLKSEDWLRQGYNNWCYKKRREIVCLGNRGTKNLQKTGIYEKDRQKNGKCQQKILMGKKWGPLLKKEEITV